MQTMHTLKKGFALAAFSAALTALPLAAYAAGSAATEIKTAATHAGFSATATDITTAHAHLHHTLNCLAGPGGDGYDKTAIDPCKNSGNGAIPDTTDADKKKSLEDVAAKTREAIAKDDLAAVKKDASEIEGSLKQME